MFSSGDRVVPLYKIAFVPLHSNFIYIPWNSGNRDRDVMVAVVWAAENWVSNTNLNTRTYRARVSYKALYCNRQICNGAMVLNLLFERVWQKPNRSMFEKNISFSQVSRLLVVAQQCSAMCLINSIVFHTSRHFHKIHQNTFLWKKQQLRRWLFHGAALSQSHIEGRKPT